MAQVVTQIEFTSGPRDRATVLLRAILIVPVVIFLSSFSHAWSDSSTFYSSSALMMAPAFLAIVFRGKYPSYVLAFNLAVSELALRIAAYFFLLTDDYPSIERNPKFTVTFPDIQEGKTLNQFLPLVKWLLAIPLYIVGLVYLIYAIAITILAWVSTILSGQYPEWAAAPVIGTIAFWNRVYGYAFLLVTDEYPSFSL